MDLEAAFGQRVQNVFAPLHENDACWIKVFLKAHCKQLVRRIEAIAIEMVYCKIACCVVLDYREGGARDFGYAEVRAEALHKTGLTGAEASEERNKPALSEAFGKLFGKGMHFDLSFDRKKFFQFNNTKTSRVEASVYVSNEPSPLKRTAEHELVAVVHEPVILDRLADALHQAVGEAKVVHRYELRREYLPRLDQVADICP